MSKKYGIVIDVAKCTGCYNCQLACKDENCGEAHAGYTAAQPMTGQFWMHVKEVERELEGALGRKVKLVDGRKKGRIEIEFYGADDREKLIENLKLFSSLRRNK